MIVKIGYIGSKHSVESIIPLAKEIAEIRLHPYVYEEPAAIPTLYKQAVSETDVICFSGIVSYYYRDRSIETEKPVLVTPFHEYMVVASLFSCILHYGVQIDEISIDLPNKVVLDQIEADLNFIISPNHVYDYNWIYHRERTKELSISEIADFHESCYEKNRTKIAVTSIHYVYDRLIQRNIPAIYMIDHQQNAQQLLKEAKKTVLYERNRGGMIAVLYFSIKSDDKLEQSQIEWISSFMESELKVVQIGKGDAYTLAFYTTRGVIEERLQTINPKDRMEIVEKQIAKKIYFGIGYGRLLYEAEENAEIALETAFVCEQSNGYIVTDQKKLIGPLIGSMTTDSIRTVQGWLNNITNQTKVNRKSMKRFIQFTELNAFQPFTVSEYAQFAQITVRTAERFIKRLYETNHLKLYGKEQSLAKGRPRNVYVLTEELENKIRHTHEKGMLGSDY